jgi:hypothetical protein
VRKILRGGALRRVGAALALAATLLLIKASPAAALDLNPKDYFQLTYDPVTFDKSTITAGETFNAIIKGKASCTKNLPLPVSHQAVITSRVIARHNISSTSLTLNENYTVTIKPLPGKKGQTYEINQTIPLQMPSNAEPGDYTITGQLIEVKVKILFLWQDITGSFSKEESMGTVKVIAPEPAPMAPQPTAPETPPVPAPSPATTLAPVSTPAPAPATTASPEVVPEPAKPFMDWWGELLLVAFVGGGTAGIILFLKYRRKER